MFHIQIYSQIGRNQLHNLTNGMQKTTQCCHLLRGQLHLNISSFRNMRNLKKPANKLSSNWLLLGVPIISFGLGTWQVKRRTWKLNLIADYEKSSNMPPIDFPNNLDELENLEYCKVNISGTFNHSDELILGPRTCVVEGVQPPVGGLLSVPQENGFNVITPFKLQDRDLTILINRGWVNAANKQPNRRANGQVEGVVNLTGVVRKGENRTPFMPDSASANRSKIYTYRDVKKMADTTGASPIYVDAIESFEGGPVGAQTRVVLRNDHLNYLVTWYGLALGTSYIWYTKIFRRRR